MIESSIDCSIHVRESPDDVKKKINCVMCTPTNSKLFHPSIDIDMKLKNPCQKPKESTIKASEIIYLGTTYYYTKSPNGIISIYQYSEELGVYTEMDRGSSVLQ